MWDSALEHELRMWARAAAIIDWSPLTNKQRAYGLRLIEELGLRPLRAELPP